MLDGKLHVGIVGGGLCGLSLAIALTKRNISFTLYEGRASFTEIGAGINIAANAHQAFQLIDPDIADSLFGLATRNPPPNEEIWMKVRLGAASGEFGDGHVVHSLVAPPTGIMTASRNELLQLLANSIPIEHARFNKKLVDVREDSNGVTLLFEDGTQDRASLLIGCDGAHSTVRRLLLGPDHPATLARFSNTGGYRAVFPMELQEELLGVDRAHNGYLALGPGGYVICYPIDGGKNVNIGLWPWKLGEWKHDEAWVLPNQKRQMLVDFADWGPVIHRIMERMGDETAFWATFHHYVKPERYFDGRICMIGDASHAMCPHQGQGAAQSMEDACVMAEVLQEITTTIASIPQSEQIRAAFEGYEAIRKPRFEKALDTAFDNFKLWSRFWRIDLTQHDVAQFQKEVEQKFRWLWNSDIEGQGKRAKAETRRMLAVAPRDGRAMLA